MVFMLTRKRYIRFLRFLEKMATHGVPQLLGVAVGMISIVLGLSLWVDPAAFLNSPTWVKAMDFASPYAWGTVYIATGLIVAICALTYPRAAQVPCFVLACTYATQGFMVLPQLDDGGVPSGFILFVGFAWICIITQLVCGACRRPPIAQTTKHH